jgi:hypothetical protein
MAELPLSLHLPNERMSRKGSIAFAVTAIALPFGVYALRRAGLNYLAPGAKVLLVLGFAALVACGFGLFSIIKRREYPWLLAFAAIALPLFSPSQAPYDVIDRVVFAIRDLALVGVAVIFLARAIGRADELERRTHLEALSWSYTIVVVALVCEALVEDLLPPIRGTWIASGMLATWFIAWVVASLRYQR